MSEFKSMNELLGDQVSHGERMGFKSGGPVSKPMESMDHGVQPAKPDGDDQASKEAGGTPKLKPKYAEGGKVKKLKGAIEALYKKRATTGGHTRRGRINDRIEKLESELQALDQSTKPKKARGGKVSSGKSRHKGRMRKAGLKKGGYTSEPMVGK